LQLHLNHIQSHQIADTFDQFKCYSVEFSQFNRSPIGSYEDMAELPKAAETDDADYSFAIRMNLNAFDAFGP